MNKLQQIRTAVDKALETQGLESTRAWRTGCVFYNKYAIDWARKITLVCYNPKNDFAHFSEQDGSVFNCQQKKYNTFEIIGRDITLEDVLLTIGQTNKGIAIRATGNFMYYGIKIHPDMHITQWSEIFGDVSEKWRFNKALHLQSQETINFIHNLIVNKK